MNDKELLFFKLSMNSKIPIKNEKFSDKRNLKKINEINTRFSHQCLKLINYLLHKPIQHYKNVYLSRSFFLNYVYH